MFNRIHVFVALVGLSYFHSTASADPPPKVLIFTDLTAGALISAKAHYQAALQMDREPRLLTESSELSSTLADGPWVDVVISVKWDSTEPAWLCEVREFAIAHPEMQITVSAWHDAGIAVPESYAMFATTGTSYWRFEQTNFGYSLAKADNRVNPVLATGLLWPPFSDIVPMDPIPELYVTSPSAYVMNQDAAPPTSQPTTQPAPPDPACVIIQAGRYWADMVTCRLNRNEMEDNCDKMHGPNAQAPFSPDPVKHAKCMNDATDTFKKCTEMAVALYNNRVAACPRAQAQ